MHKDILKTSVVYESWVEMALIFDVGDLNRIHKDARAIVGHNTVLSEVDIISHRVIIAQLFPWEGQDSSNLQDPGSYPAKHADKSSGISCTTDTSNPFLR